MRRALLKGRVMYLHVKCPNGHSLKVPHRFAGREGVCPVCKETVQIPSVEREDTSEDAILDLIGSGGSSSSTISRYAASRDDLPTNQDPSEADMAADALDESTASEGEDSSLLKIRKCPTCQKKVPPHFNVCPSCHTYLLEDSHVSETKANAKCPTCGTLSFPGTEVCEQCGTQLFLRE